MATTYEYGIKLLVEGDQQVVAATGRAGKGFADMGRDADSTAAASLALGGRLDRLDAAITGLTADLGKASGAIDSIAGAMALQGREAQEAERRTGLLAGTLGELAKLTGAIYAVQSLTGAVVGAGRALLEAQASAESLTLGLRFAVPGSVTGELEYLRKVTKDLGLDFGTTANSYKSFAAAARETSLEGEGARKVFEAVAKASGVMGLSAEQTEGTLLALSQMISKGTVQSEELRGQLGERLPGAFQIAARAMGVSTQELGKMLEQGKVISDDFLPRFARQLETELGAAAEAAGDRTGASLNRLGNAWELLVQTVAGSGIADFARGQINILTDAMDDVSGSMQRARGEGDGFFGQLVAGTGAVLRFLNPFNALTYSVQDTGEKLKAAEAELVRLQDALDKNPGDILLGGAIKDTKELIAQLKNAQTQITTLSTLRALDNQSLAAADRLAVQTAAERSKAEADLVKVKEQLGGVNQAYITQLGVLKTAESLGIIDAKEYAALVTDLADKNNKKTDSFKASAAAQKEAAAEAKRVDEAYNKLKATISDKTGALLLEQDQQTKLTAGQKYALSVMQDIQDGTLKLTDARKREITALLENYLNTEQLNTTRKAEIELAKVRAKEFDEFFDKQEKDRLAAEGRIRTGRTMLEQIQFETAALTMSTSERAIATAERELERQGVKRGTEAYEAYIDKIRSAIIGRDTVQKSVDAAKEIEQRWEKAKDQIGQGLTDSLFRAFESGKEFFSTLWDGIVNTLKTTAVRLVINATVDWAKDAGNKFLESLLGPGDGGFGKFFSDMRAGFAGWFGGLGSSVSSLIGGLGTSLGSLLNGLGSTLGSALGSITSGLGSLFGGGSSGGGLGAIGSIGSLLGNIGSTLKTGVGTVAGWLGLGGSAATSTASYASLIAGTEGAVVSGLAGAASSTGLLGAIGAAAPWVAGAMALVSLLGGSRGGPKVSGAFNSAGLGGIPAGGELDSTVANLFAGVQQTYAGIAQALGGQAGNLTGATFIAKDPNGTANTQFVLDAVLNGQQIYSRNNRTSGGNVEDVGRSDSALAAATSNASMQAVLRALQETTISPEIDRRLDAISAALSADQIKAAIGEVVTYKQQQDAAANPAPATTTGTTITGDQTGLLDLLRTANALAQEVGTNTLRNLQTLISAVYESTDNLYLRLGAVIQSGTALVRETGTNTLTNLQSLIGATYETTDNLYLRLHTVLQSSISLTREIGTNTVVELQGVRALAGRLIDVVREGSTNQVKEAQFARAAAYEIGDNLYLRLYPVINASGQGIVDQLLALRSDLKAELYQVRAQIYASEQMLYGPVRTTADVLQRVTRDGIAVQTVAAS